MSPLPWVYDRICYR